MSIDRVKKAIELENAIKQGKEAFVLLKKLEEVESKVKNIPQTDLTELENKIQELTEKINEEIEVGLEIE